MADRSGMAERGERGAVAAHGSMPTLGVLALQGSFDLHVRMLQRLGATTRTVVKPADLDGIDGLVLPGGESTVLARLAREYGLFEPLKAAGAAGLPLFGTCAGAIFLGSGGDLPPRLELTPIVFERNAYGRQLDSFTTALELTPFGTSFHGVFIRAPRCRIPPGTKARVLGTHEGDPVLVESGNLLLATFHPELTDDPRVHQYFLERCLRS